MEISKKLKIEENRNSEKIEYQKKKLKIEGKMKIREKLKFGKKLEVK